MQAFSATVKEDKFTRGSKPDLRVKRIISAPQNASKLIPKSLEKRTGKREARRERHIDRGDWDLVQPEKRGGGVVEVHVQIARSAAVDAKEGQSGPRGQVD